MAAPTTSRTPPHSPTLPHTPPREDDSGVGPSLYYIDYMGTLQPVNFGVQGYASSFTLSIFDREWREGLTRDEAMDVIRHCVEELDTRFLVDQRKFVIKAVDENGVTLVNEGELPPKN